MAKKSELTQEVVQIDSLLQDYFTKETFNGNVIVAKKEKVIFSKSFGYTDGSRTASLSAASVFSIGSISKEFQALSIMKLVDDEYITTESKLSEFITEFPKWADSISIIHLLNNVSGLPQLNFKTIKDKSDLIRDLKVTEKLTSVPGQEYLYNHNIPILLNMVIENETGLTLQKYVKENFLKALKMNETIFDPDSDHPNLALSFNSSYNNDTPYNPFKGWVYTTSNDLLKWLRATQNGTLVSNESYDILSINKFFPERLSALGNNEVTDFGHTIHHWGGYFNYISLTYLNHDKDLYIVLLSNNGCRELLNMARQIDGFIVN